MTETQLSLEPGRLVLILDQNGRAARIIRNISDSEILVQPVHQEEENAQSWWTASNIIPLNAPPPITKTITLATRRRELLDNLQRLYSNSIGMDERLVGILRMFLTRGMDMSNNTIEGMPRWFWETVASSAEDARQLSWARLPEYVDNDARRTRGRPKTFLDFCVKQGWLKLSPDQVERMAYLIGATFPERGVYTFEIVRGTALFDAYQDDDGPDSCMKGDDYPMFYANNEETVGMVKIYNKGEYMGRALLWTATTGEMLLDRIYPSDGGLHIEALLNFAREMGWDYHDRQSFNQAWHSGNSYTVQVVAWYRRGNVNPTFPYMDTFSYSDDIYGDEENTIILSDAANDYHFRMMDTDGSFGHRAESAKCNRATCRYRNGGRAAR